MAGVVQGLVAFAEALAAGTGHDVLVSFVLAYRVGSRPALAEPRVRKRSPKAYPLLTVPRDDARRRLPENTLRTREVPLQ